MSHLVRQIDDAAIEAMLNRRVPGHADRALLLAVVADATSHRQDRAFRLLIPVLRNPRLAWGAVLAAAALIGALLLVGAGSHHLSVAPAPSTGPSQPVAVASAPAATPVVSPAATAETCATETTSVLTGGAMSPRAISPMTIPAGVLSRGAYTSDSDGTANPTDVWFIAAGNARRIAEVVGPDFNLARIDDISADGRNVLLEVGVIHGGLPGPSCADLYLVSSDGSGAIRLSTNGPDQMDSGGRISPDGRWAASAHGELGANGSAFTLYDLLNGTSRLGLCSDRAETPSSLAFSPDSTRIAALCGATLELESLVSPVATTFDVPGAGEDVVGFAWRSPTSIVLVTALGGQQVNAPVRLRTLTFDGAGIHAAGTWSAARTVTPDLGDLSGGPISVAPDGHAVLVPLLVGSDPNAGGWYVIDLGTAKATLVSGQAGPQDQSAGWSSDSGKVVSMEWKSGAVTDVLVTDVRTGEQHRYGSVPVGVRWMILVGS